VPPSVPQQHDLPGIPGGEAAVELLQGFERIGARGDPAFGGVDQALGGGPGVEAASEFGAGRGDLGLGARFLGTDDRDAGMPGAEIGLQVHVCLLVRVVVLLGGVAVVV
jgi:hypothetical protein